MKKELDSLDATALIIGGGPELSARLATRWLNTPYPVLHDPERAVYRAYGFDRALGVVQRSGTVVIDSSGVVRLAHGGANPMDALRREEVLRVLKQFRPV